MAALPIGASRVVPAQLGLQCLQSVPLDTEGNIKLLEELNLYLEWQSNIAYLRNPPAEYTEDPIDILGGMEDIKQRLNSGDYLNEYDFQQDLTILFNKAYDNHFSWQSDILGTAMQFQTAAGTELISISSDGIELPRVYLFRDIQLARNDRLFEPSPVLTINNREVNEFLNAVAEQAGFHDADTRYNALFPNQAITASGVAFRGSFRAGRYQTPNTTFVFENGTSITTINIAAVFGDFTGVDSGPAFFNKFCQGNPVNEATPTTAASSTKANTESMPSQIGYPSPVAIHPELSVAGYYLDGNDYQVCIMQLYS